MRSSRTVPGKTEDDDERLKKLDPADAGLRSHCACALDPSAGDDADDGTVAPPSSPGNGFTPGAAGRVKVDGKGTSPSSSLRAAKRSPRRPGEAGEAVWKPTSTARKKRVETCRWRSASLALPAMTAWRAGENQEPEVEAAVGRAEGARSIVVE
jgi:hypothetical protein